MGNRDPTPVAAPRPQWPRHPAVRLPTRGVRQRQPAHEPRKHTILQRIQNQVPMIGHHAIRDQLHFGVLVQRLDQDPLERLEVFLVVKDRHPAVATVHDVEQALLRSGSRGSRHEISIMGVDWEKGCCPLFGLPNAKGQR